jgi:hypothetical protein
VTVENTELLPELPFVDPFGATAPPPPTVTVYPVPDVTAKDADVR